MMIRKIFHLHQSIEQSKERLAYLSSFYPEATGVKCLTSRLKGETWRIKTPFGLSGPLQVTVNPANFEERVLFQGEDQNLKLIGIVQYHAIRSNLTEIEIGVYYEVRDPLLGILDRIFKLGDKLVTRQLRKLRSHLAGDFTTPLWEPAELELQTINT